MRARVGAGMLLVGGIVAASFFWLREPPAPPDQSADLPASPTPLFAIPRPVLLKETRPVARWSTVLHELRPRATPFWGSPAAELLERTTPEGTANVVLVHRTATDPKGRLWVRISLPGLPGETRGWVPRPALGAYHAVRTHLVVDLERLTATLRRDGRSVLHVPVGIGSPKQDIQEELGHAQAFGTPIKELYGVVPGSLEFTAEQTYLQPPAAQTDVVHVIRGVIEAESGAIDHYQQIVEFCNGLDYVTQDMVIDILREQQGHKRLFEGFLREYEAEGRA